MRVCAQGAENAPWKYVVVDKEGYDNKGILTLTPGAVIKPVNGALNIISEKDTCVIEKGEMGKINHAKYAPFTIGFEAPYEGYSLHELPVTLRRVGEPYSLVDTVADSNGLLEIADLPPGDYKITVSGRARGLFADNLHATHTIDDTITLEFDEYPVKPAHILTGLAGYDRETETYKVNVSWNDLPELAALPYTYIVSVDEKLTAEVSGCEAVIEGISSGDHKIGVSGILPSGKITEETVSTVYLSNSWMATVDEISEGAEGWVYFDLTGRKVPASNLKSGVYIRNNGKVSEKVNIVGR